MSKHYKRVTLQVHPFQIIGDSYYEDLCHEAKALGYTSFSEYFKSQLIFPHVFFNQSSGQIDATHLKNELLKLDSDNFNKLNRFCKEKNLSRSQVIAKVIHTFLKDK